tara:strand:- start:674 stop:1150 length:477 start_codon:yes stop_codon:yes gene_type:complete
MSTNDDKYLVLRGKNKDIYFIQKRVSRKVSEIIGKDFIKKSLETSDILIARAKRDKILAELVSIEAMGTGETNNINNNLEHEAMSNESITTTTNIKEDSITQDLSQSNAKEGFLNEYLDMEYIRSLRLPTKDKLIDTFDDNLLLLLVVGALAVFFLLN